MPVILTQSYEYLNYFNNYKNIIYDYNKVNTSFYTWLIQPRYCRFVKQNNPQNKNKSHAKDMMFQNRNYFTNH